ncbi:MAG: serine--tRNA ligase [Alphaproteobacteria bacterium]|nr:serine--tRNA ligase [Alphaproteobacteria bacterium]|tara:strand:+ start:1001 stop:2287 length:1287 start_codon:yes stop_codon:yes gene_type:complete
MFDLKWIRENPGALDRSLQRRGETGVSEKVLELDAQRRAAQTRLQDMQQRRNTASKEIGAAMKDDRADEAEGLKAEVASLKDEMGAVEGEEKAASDALNNLLSGLPNILDEDVPDGANEDDNLEIRTVGEPPAYDFDPKEHFDIGEALGLMDFEVAAELAGSRFVILKGALARMERALADFMLDIHTQEFGYTEISPPTLVREEVLYGTGQLPKFGDDLFRTADDRWLIPTAEVPLTNMAAGKILEATELPMRVTAHTACYRAEAGAAGRDTRGMLRQHQFYKVELVSIVPPEESEDELERMTGCAEEVLKRLGLAYRVVVLCSGDTGFGAAKTHDVEVWMPGQAAHREISSCSNTRAFQARRMNARYRPAGEGKGPEYVHTLNGSGVAVGRALIAIIENYQNEDGSITVPEVLRPYMGGLEVIRSDA